MADAPIPLPGVGSDAEAWAYFFTEWRKLGCRLSDAAEKADTTRTWWREAGRPEPAAWFAWKFEVSA